MTELLHKRGVENLISRRDRQDLIDYAEGLMQELPAECAACPAAYLCAVALQEDDGSCFPRTPHDVRFMQISIGGSGWKGMSGQAQSALKSIVRDANERGTGPSDDGTSCCLSPNTTIDINKADLYDY